MLIHIPFEIKRMRETVQGELFSVPQLGQPADIGFVIDVIDGGQRRIAVLYTGDNPEQRPYWSITDGEFDCLSYGTAWVFEVIPPSADEAFLTGDARLADGVVSILREDVLIKLGRDPGQATRAEAHINLRTFAGKNEVLGSPAFGFARWQIWRTTADKTDDRQKPILRFGF